MKRIFKYPLTMTTEQVVNLPKSAEILTVQAQHNLPCLWAIIDDTEIETDNNRMRTIFIFGTGHPLPEDLDRLSYRYVSTFQLFDGVQIYHVFERYSNDNID